MEAFQCLYIFVFVLLLQFVSLFPPVMPELLSFLSFFLFFFLPFTSQTLSLSNKKSLRICSVVAQDTVSFCLFLLRALHDLIIGRRRLAVVGWQGWIHCSHVTGVGLHWVDGGNDCSLWVSITVKASLMQSCQHTETTYTADQTTWMVFAGQGHTERVPGDMMGCLVKATLKSGSPGGG